MNGPTFAPAAPPTTALAPVARPRTPRPAARPDAPANGGAMVLTYLRLHWMMIVFCGAALGAGLSYTAWTVLPVKYESYAMLQVASNPFSVAGGNDPGQTHGQTAFATYVKTCKTRLKSERVLDAALSDSRYKIAATETLKAQKDPLRYLEEKLVVDASEGSGEIITVRLEGDRPEDLAPIVNAVKDAFLKTVVDEDVTKKTGVKDLLEKIKLTLGEQLRVKVAPPAASSKSRFAPPPLAPVPPTGPTGGPTPDPNVVQASGVAPAGAGAGVAVAESDAFKKMRMVSLQNRIDKVEVDLPKYAPAVAEMTTQIEALKAKVAADPGPPSAPAVAAAENDPEVKHLEAKADQLEKDAKFKFATSNNQSADVHRRNAAAASAARAEAERLKRETAARLDKSRVEARAAQLAADLDRAVQTLRVTLENERLAKQQVAKDRAELAALPPDVKKDDATAPFADPLKTDIQTQDEVFGKVSTQLQTLSLELQSPRRVTADPASTPRQKDAKKQVTAAVVAALAGFALVGFGAVAYEVRVRKVSSLAELKTAGPTPVVGVVPWEPAEAADPLRRADTAEGVDKLRATVAQEWLGRGPATIVVTSPLGDEGKAFTAFRLATSLAQAGVRTLLVDFDLRTPSLHQFAGVPNSCGVVDILRGEAGVRAGQIVMPSGLAFLPAGEWARPATGADPAGAYPTLGAALDPLLHELRAEVDCLILHGHALLTAADTVEIARRCDVVLLCAQYRETRLPLVKRAADRVAAMAGPQAGVVYLGASRHEALC